MRYTDRTIACTRYAWPHLKASRGHVVGLSSLAGKTGVPERTTYCASKFDQSGFLDALRIEAEDHGIAVTVVCPGVVATEIRRHGLNGPGETAGVSGPEELGAMSDRRMRARSWPRCVRAGANW
jgi:short-subunit dehydrogenase